MTFFMRNQTVRKNLLNPKIQLIMSYGCTKDHYPCFSKDPQLGKKCITNSAVMSQSPLSKNAGGDL